MTEIRKLEGRDLKQVHDIGSKVPEFSANDDKHTFWPVETLERFAQEGLSLVIEDNERVVGFLLAAYQPVTKKLTWENMYVDPEYRGRELAERCFEKSWDEARKIGATMSDCVVPTANDSSRRMLEKLGFSSAGDYQWMLKFKD